MNMWTVSVGILLIIISLWFGWRKKKFSLFKELGIPGPEPNWLFGNLWEMSIKTPVVCQKEWIEKYGKVLGFYFGGTPTLLVADVELLKVILVKDFQKFTNKVDAILSTPNLKSGDTFSNRLTRLKGKRWKEVRGIITPSFTTCKMKMMAQTINSAMDPSIEIMESKAIDGESFDIYKLFQRLTMDVICQTAFGIQPDCDCNNKVNDTLIKAAKSIFSEDVSSMLYLISNSFPELGIIWKYVNKLKMMKQNDGQDPFTYLAEVIKDVIKTRRFNCSSRRKDLIQIMIDAGIAESEISNITDEQLTAVNDETEDKSEIANDSTSCIRYMTDKEIVDNSLLFFLAGFETTSTALAFIAHFLVHNPEVQKKIREEIYENVGSEGKIDYNSLQQMQYLDQVISESLRIYPPVNLIVHREAEENVVYGPFKIKKGMAVQIPVYYLNHDPDLWAEPEKFDPIRFSPENKGKQNSMAFMTFGVGPRNCVGMRFARLTAKLAIARILEKYQLLETEETESDPITLKVTLTLISPKNGVNLRIKPV